MKYLNTSGVEKLKNGCIFSTMHTPIMKTSEFKPTIVILGNENCKNEWTDDRLTCSTTTPGLFQFISQDWQTLTDTVGLGPTEQNYSFI